MKRLGLIGGIGTLAGVDLVQRMVRECAKEGAHEDSDFPEFVYLNIPTHETTATGSIPSEAQREIMRAFDALETLNCDVALTLCNTAHFLFDEFSKWFCGDIINMVQIACSRAKGNVAVLASRYSIDHDLFGKPLRERGCKTVELTDGQQKVVDTAIKRCMGFKDMPVSSHELNDLAFTLFNASVNTIILGCTELSVFSVQELGDGKVIDAGFVAIQEALRLCR